MYARNRQLYLDQVENYGLFCGKFYMRTVFGRLSKRQIIRLSEYSGAPEYKRPPYNEFAPELVLKFIIEMVPL